MLSDRQLLLLQVIIDDFIRSAHPVGSRSLAKKEEIALSSATIRNEMADLEEMGLIEKTHASSGRVPSEKGYRFYVDHLLSPQKLEQEDIKKIQSLFKEKIFEIEELIQNSAVVLSELTEYTSIVLGPTVKENRLNRFQIIPLNDQTAVAIIVTNTGHIEHKVFTLPNSVTGADLEKTVNILNSRLVGVPLDSLQEKLRKEVLNLFQQHLDNYNSLYKAMTEVLKLPSEEKLFYGGKMNMLKQPEFQDVAKIQEIFDLLEEEKHFTHLLKKMPLGVQVKIGSEIMIPEMENFSMITATYKFGDKQLGKVALLGPKRMNYSRAISVLNIFSKNLSYAFTKLFNE